MHLQCNCIFCAPSFQYQVHTILWGLCSWSTGNRDFYHGYNSILSQQDYLMPRKLENGQARTISDSDHCCDCLLFPPQLLVNSFKSFVNEFVQRTKHHHSFTSCMIMNKMWILSGGTESTGWRLLLKVDKKWNQILLNICVSRKSSIISLSFP